jgi:hypothetical protein
MIAAHETHRAMADQRTGGGVPYVPIPKTWAMQLSVPLWLLAIVLPILPAWRFLQICRRPPPEGTFCPQCHYDLRANPDRCPECGTENPAKKKKP